MHTASSGVIRAASPSAFTSHALDRALAATRHAERIRAACAAVDDAVSAATQRVRLTLGAPRTAKRKAATAAAQDALVSAEAIADATADALGRGAAQDSERAALCALARAVFADRVDALAVGPSWTGSGYCAALAVATRSLGPDKREAHVDALGAEDGEARAYVVVGTSSSTGEPYALHVVARCPSAGTFDAYAVYVPEVRAYGSDADRPRGEVTLGLTSTRLTAADARPLAEAANVAAACADVAARYAVAHPFVDAAAEARATLATAYATAYGEPLTARA
jgi:hypothetical protein